VKALDTLFSAIVGGGPWPAVVLFLGTLALLLGAFIIVQRGRKKATFKFWIGSIDISGEIEERPLSREKNLPPAAPPPAPRRKLGFPRRKS
jgi:hypothetical protein